MNPKKELLWGLWVGLEARGFKGYSTYTVWTGFVLNYG